MAYWDREINKEVFKATISNMPIDDAYESVAKQIKDIVCNVEIETRRKESELWYTIRTWGQYILAAIGAGIVLTLAGLLIYHNECVGWRQNYTELHACQRGDEMGCLTAVKQYETSSNSDEITTESKQRIALLRTCYALKAGKPLPDNEKDILGR